MKVLIFSTTTEHFVAMHDAALSSMSMANNFQVAEILYIQVSRPQIAVLLGGKTKIVLRFSLK